MAAMIEKKSCGETIGVVNLLQKKSDKPSITWSQAVDEALCFGWIDNNAVLIDEKKYMQFFCKRKAKVYGRKLIKTK